MLFHIYVSKTTFIERRESLFLQIIRLKTVCFVSFIPHQIFKYLVKIHGFDTLDKTFTVRAQ